MGDSQCAINFVFNASQFSEWTFSRPYKHGNKSVIIGKFHTFWQECLMTNEAILFHFSLRLDYVTTSLIAKCQTPMW